MHFGESSTGKRDRDKTHSWASCCLMLLLLICKCEPSVFILPPPQNREKARREMGHRVNIKSRVCSCPFLGLAQKLQLRKRWLRQESWEIFANIWGGLSEMCTLRLDVLCARTAGGERTEVFASWKSSQISRHTITYHLTIRELNPLHKHLTKRCSAHEMSRLS